MNLEMPETATKAVQTVTETTGKVGAKAREYGDVATETLKGATETAQSVVTEYGGSAVTTVTGTATSLFDQTRELAKKGFVRVKDFQVGDKNVGERAQATVETVSERIDVEQLSDQVKKARHQMEGALSTWLETFRPSTKEPAEKPAAKKPAAKKATTTAKKPAAKKATTTAKKTTTAAKKPAAKKATTTAKKPAAKKTTTTTSSTTKSN